VPLAEAGVASGTNSTLRELGGVLGVAVLAAVFARHSVYASHPVFVDGFRAALWVSVGLSALGVLAAALSPRRPRDTQAIATDPAFAFAGESH
jgi:hypothetical protein